MRALLIALLSLSSISAFAKCITLDLIAYEVVCKNDNCIAPALSPTPKKIQLKSDVSGGYFYMREIAPSSDPYFTVFGMIYIEDHGTHYNLSIGSQYHAPNGGNYNEVYEDILGITDITSFQGREVKGKAFHASDETVYYPRVGVYPSSVDLCK